MHYVEQRLGGATYQWEGEDLVSFADWLRRPLGEILLRGYRRTDIYPMDKEAGHNKSKVAIPAKGMIRTSVQVWSRSPMWRIRVCPHHKAGSTYCQGDSHTDTPAD